MQFNIADIYESLADAFPDRKAVVSGDIVLTYGQLDVRANRLANYWRSQGIGAEDHIGLYLYNGIEYVEAMLAAWKLRARTINVNYRYVAHELQYIIDNAELKGILYEADLADEVDSCTFGVANPLKMVRGPAYEAALASASPARDFPARSEDDLFILYTGGTTGMPRGVMWRQRDLFFAALQGGQPGGEAFESAEEMAPLLKEYGGGIHIHSAAPMIHGSSQLASWIALMNGGIAGLVPGRSYDPAASLRLCSEHEMHTFNLVGDAMALPLIQELEKNADQYDLSSLNVISSAGAILSNHIRKRMEELVPSAMVLNNFGSSETGHQGSAFYEGDKPIFFMDEGHTVVLDDNLDPVKPGSGDTGMLARFGAIPLGYWKDEAKTAATFKTKDGVRYVIPGDRAAVAEDGSVLFLGRDSVCINSGGEKVFAEEVEEALKHHETVFDAVVVGVPDDRWGARVEAILTLREGCEADVEAIRAFCRGRIAGYKVPRAIWVVDDLNRQPSGKPDYRWAKAKAIELGAAS